MACCGGEEEVEGRREPTSSKFCMWSCGQDIPERLRLGGAAGGGPNIPNRLLFLARSGICSTTYTDCMIFERPAGRPRTITITTFTLLSLLFAISVLSIALPLSSVCNMMLSLFLALLFLGGSHSSLLGFRVTQRLEEMAFPARCGHLHTHSMMTVYIPRTAGDVYCAS